MSFNPPTAAKSNHTISFQNKQNDHQLKPQEPGRDTQTCPLSLCVHSLIHVEEPLKAREPKWHLREKGAVPGSYWQKSTEDGYSTSGSKVLPKAERDIDWEAGL